MDTPVTLRKKSPLVLLLLASLLLSSVPQTLSAQKGLLGKVFVGKKEKWSINEKNTVKNGKKLKIVEYHDSNGKLVWRGEVSYTGNDLDPIKYEAEDLRFGYEEGHFKNEGFFILTRKKDKNASQEEKLVWQKGDYMCGLLVADYCRSHMDQLTKGKTLDFDILGPSHLRTAGFQVSVTGDKNIRGIECHEVTFEPSSIGVSLFVDPSYFYFSKKKPYNLIRYIGRHGITGDNGETIKGTIDYIGWD